MKIVNAKEFNDYLNKILFESSIVILLFCLISLPMLDVILEWVNKSEYINYSKYSIKNWDNEIFFINEISTDAKILEENEFLDEISSCRRRYLLNHHTNEGEIFVMSFFNMKINYKIFTW